MKSDSGVAGVYVLIITLIALTAVMIVIAPTRRDYGVQVTVTATTTERSFWRRLFSDDSPRPASVPAPVAKFGVRGIVKVGPVCPVIRAEDNARCADKPYAVTLSIKSAAGKEVSRPTSDVDGRFEVELFPGVYTLSFAEPHALLPRMASTTFTVTKAKFADISVTLDSGIR